MKKIYLTGISASGKTTLIDKITKSTRNVEVISYSKLLIEYLRKNKNLNITVEELRQQSSLLISPTDVLSVDQELINMVENIGKSNHIIVDSHAITCERYGFRSTPFNYNVLKKLNFDLLVSLFSSTDIIHQRLSTESEGRRYMSNDNIVNSVNLQNSLLLIYGNALNLPVYFLDESNDDSILIEWFNSMLE